MTSADRTAETVRLFLRAVESHRIPMSGDMRVTERGAAELLGIHEATLRAMRGNGDGPTAVRVPVAGSRLSYSIIALAEWIEARRER